MERSFPRPAILACALVGVLALAHPQTATAAAKPKSPAKPAPTQVTKPVAKPAPVPARSPTQTATGSAYPPGAYPPAQSGKPAVVNTKKPVPKKKAPAPKKKK